MRGIFLFFVLATTPCLAEWSAWSEWSACSLSCGGGQQTRVRTCESTDHAQCQDTGFEIDQLACNDWECFQGEWGEWSPCEEGWHFRERCDENFDCDFEEGECGVDEPVNQEWTAWSACDPSTERRSRDRCTPEFGCEVDEEDCNVEEIGSELSSWGVWGPCVHGLKTRHLCTRGGVCTEEEVVECRNNQWSEWGECKGAKQERTKCDRIFGCQSEQRPCGGALYQGEWSEWGKCVKGFSSRHKCNAEGQECQLEEKECRDDGAGEWSEWSECKEGFQERDKCNKNMECSLESRPCKEQGGKYISWSGWGKCGADGYHNRVMCGHTGCQSESRRCNFGGVIKEVQAGDGVYLDPDADARQQKNSVPDDDFLNYFEDYAVHWDDLSEWKLEPLGVEHDSDFADLLGLGWDIYRL